MHAAPVYMCFANATLPDTDYRIAFARTSTRFRVLLALPGRPQALPAEQYVPLPVGAGLSMRSLAALLRVPFMLRRHRVAVAHFFATQLSLVGPVMATLVGSVPIVTITGLGRAFQRDARWSALLRLVYVAVFVANTALTHAVLFQNPDDMATLTRYLPASLRRRCLLIGSAVDASFFGEGPAKQVASGPSVCLLVSRLLPAKGIDDYLRLADRLGDDARFVLIGPPSSGHPAVLEAVEAAQREGVVEYLGALTSSQVRERYQDSTILLHLSHSEGLPRVLLEAALSFLPSVAYDIAGCRAALGPAAPLVPLGDADVLENRVRQLLADEDRRATQARTAEAYVRQHFSTQAYSRRLESVLVSATTGAQRE